MLPSVTCIPLGYIKAHPDKEMAGRKWRERNGGKKMAGRKWREESGGKEMAGEIWRENKWWATKGGKKKARIKCRDNNTRRPS